MSTRFTVLGAGTWGTVMANHLNEAGYEVTLWHYRSEFADEIARTRSHPHLEGFSLRPAIAVTSDLHAAAAASDFVVLAVPSQKVRGVVSQIPDELNTRRVVNLSKGIEQTTLMRMSEVISEAGNLSPDRVASVYGPSHAEEVMKHIPTTLVAASNNMAYARELQVLLSTEDFRVYANDDIVGVELGGSVKNVIAIAAGICQGIGSGDNTMAALLTRGLAELTRLGFALGAQLQTFAGLSGVGDLAVTVYSKFSRNHRLGVEIGQGASVEQGIKSLGMVAEGVYTAKSALGLAGKAGVEMPICQEVYNVLFEKKDPLQAITDLMTRELRDEMG